GCFPWRLCSALPLRLTRRKISTSSELMQSLERRNSLSFNRLDIMNVLSSVTERLLVTATPSGAEAVTSLDQTRHGIWGMPSSLPIPVGTAGDGPSGDIQTEAPGCSTAIPIGL